MKRVVLLLTVVTVLLGGALAAFAAVPPMINYQGKLLKPDGTAVADGTYSMRFALYEVAVAGDPVWSETNAAVQVKKGLFAVLLGSIVNLPANVFDSPNRWFGVKVGDDAEMTPRQQVTTTAFAFKAAVADTVVDGAVTTAKLADGAVTGAKLAPDATSSISEAIATGWIPANEAWTYASATNITVPTGAASKYSVGDKIKFTQTTVKYFYITAVSDTSLTITAGTDYTLTNIAITTPNYSHASSPVGFPQWFNWSPTITVGSGTFTAINLERAEFKIDGRNCIFNLDFTGTTSANNVNINASPPLNFSVQDFSIDGGACVENGPGDATGGYYTLNGNKITFRRYDQSTFTIGVARGCHTSMTSYPFSS